VDRIETLVTVDDPARVDEFLERCIPGSAWFVQIRTAQVLSTLIHRIPLGTFDERDCTCLSLQLTLPVPVEPGLRIRISGDDDDTLTASGIVRPWES
jgi:hypothetical protein